ncbi:MAG: tRNA (N6-isopentenyl adenosine(37)-C2)-methylthiotransferase MiaB [Longimicrobiales bacterium]
MMRNRPHPRAYVETYGCQMNISDGELMEGLLAEQGYEIVHSPEDADVVLVNTCAIREHAETRVLGRVSQLNGLKRDNPDLVIGVTGCMAQRLGTSLLEQAPYVDLVMGPDGYRALPESLQRIRNERSSRGRTQLAVVELQATENYQGLEQRRAEGPVAWVPIQRGCDHRCTFCIVPYVRGPEKNRDAAEVLAEIEGLAARGVSEVTLLGQTVNSYRSGDVTFPALLRRVARVPGIRRVRFTSPHPNDVTPELVEAMAEESALCEHLHLPAQSGSDRTLRRMLRRYTVAELIEKVELVRAAVPDVAISTDIIVAFPGETDAEFRETLELMRTVRFDEAYTYKYSLRDGTPAARLPAEDFLGAEEAQARLAELIKVSRGVAAEINAREIGRVEEVLIERPGRDAGQVLGRTRRNKMVVFDGDAARIGEYVRVELLHTTGATFSGAEVATAATAVGA